MYLVRLQLCAGWGARQTSFGEPRTAQTFRGQRCLQSALVHRLHRQIVLKGTSLTFQTTARQAPLASTASSSFSLTAAASDSIHRSNRCSSWAKTSTHLFQLFCITQSRHVSYIRRGTNILIGEWSFRTRQGLFLGPYYTDSRVRAVSQGGSNRGFL